MKLRKNNMKLIIYSMIATGYGGDLKIELTIMDKTTVIDWINKRNNINLFSSHSFLFIFLFLNLFRRFIVIYASNPDPNIDRRTICSTDNGFISVFKNLTRACCCWRDLIFLL